MTSLVNLNRVFGVLRFRKNSWFFFNLGYFIVALLWFSGCSISGWKFTFDGRIQTLRMVVIFLGFTVLQINALSYLVIFSVACQKTSIDELFTLSSQVFGGSVNFQTCLYHRRFPTILLCSWWILNQITSIYGQFWTNIYNEGVTSYKSSCKNTSYIFSSNLFLQFYCWTLVIGFGSQQLIKKLRLEISLLQNGSKLQHSCKEVLNDAMSQIQVILKLRQKILKIYGSCIFVHQFSSLINFTVNFFGLILVNDNKSRLFFLMKLQYSLVITYIPHWIGQLSIREVSSDTIEDDYIDLNTFHSKPLGDFQ